MRVFFRLLVVTLFVICTAPGCGPTLSEEDLGTVIYEQDQLPRTDETYPPPFPAPEEDEHDHSED